MKSFIEYDVYCNFFSNVSFAIKIFINRKKETPLYFENYIEVWYFNENSDSEEYRYPDFSFNPITNSCFPINAFRGLYTNRGNLYRDEFFYERNIEDEPFCPWSFYRVICVYVQSPLAFVIGKVWEIERFQIARARVLQWRASSESHVRSSELHRRPRYTRIHLRGATFIFCYRELYLDGGRVARLKNSR